LDLQLKGKRALITGASKGIRFAVAKSLAAEGCHLELAARGADGLEAARKMLAQSAPGTEVRTHAADLSKVEDQERLAQACTAVDILVNKSPPRTWLTTPERVRDGPAPDPRQASP
jgi:hypothetical protein